MEHLEMTICHICIKKSDYFKYIFKKVTRVVTTQVNRLKVEGLKWLDSGRNLLLTILYKTVYYRNQLLQRCRLCIMKRR